MVVGRLDLNLGSTKDVFRDAHFGKESWFSFGLDGSYHGALEDSIGVDDGSNAAAGVDGMVDVPWGGWRLLGRGELNTVSTDRPGPADAIHTTVWMLGLGVLVANQRFQPIVRFDETRLDDAAGGGVKDVTYLGANFYQKGHGLKIQGDVRFESGTGEPVDGARLQAQIDF
jgi:hypothetical protein